VIITFAGQKFDEKLEHASAFPCGKSAEQRI